MPDELRQHPRIRAERLKVRVADRAALEAHLRDISEGGLYLESAAPPPPGSPLTLELLCAPEAKVPLLLSGRVLRIDGEGFALKLDPLLEATLEQLTALITTLAATEPGAPEPQTLDEAKARIAALQAELAVTRERHDKAHREVIANRAFLARALAGATGVERRGPGVGHAVFLGLGLLAGVVTASALMVWREPGPQPAPLAVAPMRPTLLALFDAGRPVVASAHPSSSDVVRPDAGAADAGASAVARPSRPAEAAVPVIENADDSGHLTLKANAAAEVWLDGLRLGLAPRAAVAAKPGRHQVRFDCLTDGGRKTGQPQTVDVVPFADTDLDFDCQ